MEPSHLSDDELQYELGIRGVYDVTEKRAATKTLRIDLNDELKGLRPAPYSKLSPIRGREMIDAISEIVSGLLSELSGAKGRKDLNAASIIESKLIHNLGKIERLSATDSKEVEKIEKMQRDVRKALDKNSVGRATSSTGAIPKSVATNTMNVETIDTPALIEEEVASGGRGENEATATLVECFDSHQSLNKSVEALSSQPLAGQNVFSNRSPMFDNNRQLPHVPQRNTMVGISDFDRIINSNEGTTEIQGPNRGGFNPNMPEYDVHRNYDFPRNQPPVAPQQARLVNHPAPRNSGNFSNAYARNANQYNRTYANEYQPNRDGYNYSREGQRPNIQNNRMESMPRRRNPIAEWNLTFSGDSKDTSLNDFLSQVSLLARAERVSDDDLLMSAVYLFKGSAYTWYRAFHPYYGSWEQLVAGLKSQFLPVDYDFWLLKELEQRRQGENENFGIFFAAMEMLFRNLSYRLGEPQKLAIVMRNMHPLYVDRLSLENIVSLPQLAEKCKRIEQARYRVGRQVTPQISRRDLLEPAFAYQGQYVARHRVAEIEQFESDEPDYLHLAHVSSAAQNIRLCYNCGEQGHRFNQCNAERKLFCYKCGMQDCVVRTCVRCQSKPQGNEHASSYHRGGQNSQNIGIRAPKF